MENNKIIYKRAKMSHIAFSQLFGAASMCFYMLMTYATYIGNVNYGIIVAVTGVIITVSRLFDGITDPLVAFIIERFDSKFGKVRIFLFFGWGIMACATTLMCNIGPGHLNGILGLIFFVVCYAIYIIGYTCMGIAGAITGNIMTNDPRQRPTISVFGTIYSYLAPMLISIISMVVLLPKYDNQVGQGFLAEFNLVAIVMAFIFCLFACLGITPYDKPENFRGNVEKEKNDKTSFRDIVALIRDNKELQRYMWAAVSDKLAQTVGSVSVVSVMLFGIMIGNYSISTILSTVAILPGIIFAIIGAKLAGKNGNKKTMVDWTWVCLFLNILYGLFLLFTDTTKITVALIPSIIFFVFTFGNNAVKMVVSTATNAYRMDVVDYECYRSGNFMPATVSAAYSFVDKLVSSLGATIATGMIALIGYTDTVPQNGDPLTMGVKIMTVLLLCGFPILGWVITLIALKNSELSKEKMEEVQRTIKERQTK